MSKDKDTQGIVRAGRGEQQPLDKDRAQTVSITENRLGPQDREPGKSKRDAEKKPKTSGHS
jgi:hypothetical protein